jgi:hypothetical protein
VAVRQCEGEIRGLKGQTICFTGQVLVDGVWTVRTRCADKVEQYGATSKTDFSQKVTLVVYGDLTSKVVTDDRRAYSRTLVDAEAQRRRGLHVCVVDADGFSKLLKGHSAPCLELRKAATGRVLPVGRSESEAGILGGPLLPQRIGRRIPVDLTLDLSLLDKGRAAHESTVAALIAHLSGQALKARTHAPGAPEFDAGWSNGRDVFVAEVKSLTGAREDQQIRLGIGQVLDYTYQLRSAHPGRRIRPVLVLEKRPTDARRWTALSRGIDIRLTWAPQFTGL